MRGVRLLLWPAAVALGVVAEWALYGLGDPQDWVPDLVAGWSLIACGLIAWSRRPTSRSGALMTATGGAWFAGNFFSQLLYLHRGPLVQLVLTYPSGRVRGGVERVAVAVAYVAAVITAVWRSETATIALSVLLVTVAGYRFMIATGRERRERLAAAAASSWVGLVLAGDAAIRLAFPAQAAISATLLAYQLALCVLAAALLAGLLRRPWERAGVTDLVVELGHSRSGQLRDALARALGDPSLEVGFWLPGSGAFVDAGGRTVEVPVDRSERSVTRVERDGRTVAVLVHDPAVLDDPGLVRAVDDAARLAASNARLHAEVRAQVTELQASRRRLVLAGDAERRRLERRLRDGAERRLTALAGALARARTGTDRNSISETAAKVARAEDRLAGTLAELHELAAGLHPRVLSDGGLAPALGSLVERSALPVALDVTAERFPAEIEAAAYFACSEAVANVSKYASASHIALTVAAGGGHVRVEITDDGVGGADASRGSGIRGLADRVEVLGGTLEIVSPPGEGTVVSVALPLDDHASGVRDA